MYSIGDLLYTDWTNNPVILRSENLVQHVQRLPILNIEVPGLNIEQARDANVDVWLDDYLWADKFQVVVSWSN